MRTVFTRRLVDFDDCFRQVRAGIEQLHALGFVHNDIHSDNVMFVDRVGGNLVVIGFDSCAVKGDQIPDKRGATPDGVCTEEFENDFLGLEVFREGLMERERALRNPAV